MLYKVGDGDPLIRVVNEQLIKELDAFQGDRYLEGNGPRSLLELFLVVGVRATEQQLARQHRVVNVGDSPDVNLVVVDATE